MTEGNFTELSISKFGAINAARACISLLVILLVAAPALAEQEIPSLAPVVRSVFPHGVKKGSTAVIELVGQNLDGAKSLTFAGRLVQATILSSTGSRIRARVSAAVDAEVGTRDFRLLTGRGSYVGVFDIGSLDEVTETEPNDDPRQPQKITLPVLVNGVIKEEDYDHFLFHADEGEALAFDVVSTRNGSKLDANVAILDSRGRELAWNEDYTPLGDPRLEYRFERGGDYIVRVGSLAGSNFSDYRLVAGRVPYISHVLPAGLQRGKTTEVMIGGTHLEETTAVWLGDRIAFGRILRKSSDSVRISMFVPESASLGKHWLHLATDRIETAVPIPMLVSNFDEITVTAAPSTPPQALPIQTPQVVNGIIEQPKGSHFFSFRAGAGQQFEFHVDSMELGYHLDPTLTLFDSSGTRLAAADDPGRDERSDEVELDPQLSYRFEKPGIYLVAVRDSMYRGDPRFVYRLSVMPAQPDFIVEVREPLKTAYIGQKADMLLRVRRRGGWDAPVEVFAEGLQRGITAEKQIVPPKDSIVKDTCGVNRVIDGTIAILPIQASGASPGLYHFTVKGRGVMNGLVVEHFADIHYEHLATGHTHGAMQVPRIDLTVLPVPNVIFTVPEEVTVEAGRSSLLKVSVSRFLEARNTPLVIKPKAVRPGVTVESARLDAQTRQVTLNVAALPQLRVGELSLVLSAETEQGKYLGESSTIVIRVVTKTEQP